MRGILVSIHVAILVGCAPAARPPGGGGDDDTTDGNGGNSDCADGTESIYVIDQFGGTISRFDPQTTTFTDLGAPQCPTMPGATPFSMSVDRGAVAWVLYSSGELFRVALPGLACAATTWTSPNSLKVFGMGFSTDDPGGSAETLWIGGGLTQTQSSYTLAKVDPATMVATPVATEPQLPEMTGTGNAELWGFFPDATMPRVVKLDKTTGAIATSFPQPTLAGTMTGYAFAHWGGDYWVFLLKNGESATTIYQVSGSTGAITSTTPTAGRTIVGAGVSTCAPVVVL